MNGIGQNLCDRARHIVRNRPMFRRLAWGLGICGIGAYIGYWFLYAASPAFEGDDIHMLAGVELLLRGWTEPLYRYENQPLYYWLLVGVVRFLRLPVPVAGVVVSTVSLAGILGLLFLLVRRLCSLRSAVLAVLSAVLIQELVISGIYPNTAIVAMAFAMAAFCLIFFSRGWPAAVAAAIMALLSVFIRNDTIFLLPSFFAYLLFRRRFAHAVWGAVIIGIGFVTFAQILNAPMQGMVGHAQGHFKYFVHDRTGIWRLWIILTAAPVSVIGLGFIGIVYLLRRGNWQAVALSGLTVVPIGVFYWPALTTAKYYLYTAPVLAWLAAQGWQALRWSRPGWLSRLSRSMVAAVLFIQLGWGCSWLPLSKMPLHYDQGWWYFYANDGPRPLTNILQAPYQYNRSNRKSLLWAEVLRLTEPEHDRVYLVDPMSAHILAYHFAKQADEILTGDRVPFGWRPLEKAIYVLPNGTRAAIFDSSVERVPRWPQWKGTREYVLISDFFWWKRELTIDYPAGLIGPYPQKITRRISDRSGEFDDGFLWDYFR